MPFGMKNSPASFQGLINKVTADLEGGEAYIDDVIIYCDTWEEHLTIIREIEQNNAYDQSFEKRVWASAGNFLGHVVEQHEVKSASAKVEAIANFPRPESKK